MRKLLAISLLAISLNASAMTLLQEKSFNLGAEHGCASGKAAAGNIFASYAKDIDLYMSDEYYKEGWTSNFALCKGSADNLNNLMNSTAVWW